MRRLHFGAGNKRRRAVVVARAAAAEAGCHDDWIPYEVLRNALERADLSLDDIAILREWPGLDAQGRRLVEFGERAAVEAEHRKRQTRWDRFGVVTAILTLGATVVFGVLTVDGSTKDQGAGRLIDGGVEARVVGSRAPLWSSAGRTRTVGDVPRGTLLRLACETGSGEGAVGLIAAGQLKGEWIGVSAVRTVAIESGDRKTGLVAC